MTNTNKKNKKLKRLESFRISYKTRKNKEFLINSILKTTPIILIAILSPFFVSAAHFVCGNVYDSEEGVSAGWRYAMIYYPNDIKNNESCMISPENNRFCCDAETIPGHTWSIGDIIFAEVVETEGFVDGPVYVETTGEGYDMMPDMRIRYAINATLVNGSSYEINESINISVKTYYPYTKGIMYSFNESSNRTLCIDCNNSIIELNNLTEDNYVIEIYANKSGGTFISKRLNFSVGIEEAPPQDNNDNTGSGDTSSEEGGSSGGGAGGFYKRVTLNEDKDDTEGFTRFNVVSGKPVFYKEKDEESPFERIVFYLRTKEDKKEAYLKADFKDKLPEDYYIPKESVFYKKAIIQTRKIFDKDIEDILIRFKVKKIWLSQNNFKANDINIIKSVKDISFIEMAFGKKVLEENYDYKLTQDSDYFYYEIKTTEIADFILYAKKKEEKKEAKASILELKKDKNKDSERMAGDYYLLMILGLSAAMILCLIILVLAINKKRIKESRELRESLKTIKIINKAIKKKDEDTEKDMYEKLSESYHNLKKEDKIKIYPRVKKFLDKINNKEELKK